MATIYTKDDWGTGWAVTILSAKATTTTGGRSIQLELKSDHETKQGTLAVNRASPDAFIGARILALITGYPDDKLLHAFYFDEAYTAPVFRLDNLGLRFSAALRRFETYATTK